MFSTAKLSLALGEVERKKGPENWLEFVENRSCTPSVQYVTRA
jgi:hypothetical protein